MVTLKLLSKEFREHGLAGFSLACVTIIVFFIMRAQNRLADFSMSDFEIIRLMLIAYIPLLALIVGNRLIVQEYFAKTWLFIEALPVPRLLPILVKFFSGWFYLLALTTVIVVVTALNADFAEDVDASYTALVMGKSFALTTLYWSIVFVCSLCGSLRILLYALIVLFILIAIQSPIIDASLIPPIGLIDEQLFVFEREIIPWELLLGTLFIALVFTALGLWLVQAREGSIVNRLARPLGRSDFTALGVLLVAGLSAWTVLFDETEPNLPAFKNSNSLSFNSPNLSALYLRPKYRQRTLELASALHLSLQALQTELGIVNMPRVQLVLTPDREKHDIDYETSTSVFVAGNWSDNTSYEDAVLKTVILHGVMSVLTNDRAVFEPYHWILDGFTRWWVEESAKEIDPEHYDELIARALWALKNDENAVDLIHRWQETADRFAYPTAEALAWSAIHYLNQQFGREVVLSIASEYLTRPVGHSFVSIFLDRRRSIENLMQGVAGLSLSDFFIQWQEWLMTQETLPGVQEKLARIPHVVGVINQEVDAYGYTKIYAGYESLESVTNETDVFTENSDRCQFRHDYLGPFDTEYEPTDTNREIVPCRLTPELHSLESYYAKGDRVYIALDYRSSSFHQPLRLYTARVDCAVITLIRKEFLQLRPLMYLWLSILFFGYLSQITTERSDEQTFGSWCSEFCSYGINPSVAIIAILISMVTAYSLFPNEYRNSTIEFLRALPIPFYKLFLAKLSAAFILLLSLIIASYVIDYYLLSQNPESIGGKFYSQVWLTLMWRDAAFSLIILAHGVFISCFRIVGIVVYAIYLLLLTLGETYLGSIGNWSVFAVLANEYYGSSLIVNYHALTIHLGIALLLLWISFLIWKRRDSSSLGGQTKTIWQRFFQRLIYGLGFLVLFSVLTYSIYSKTTEVENTDYGITATDHYRVIYKQSDAGVVDYVLRYAEEDYRKLAELLGVVELPKIRVDLTAESEHAAGLASWKKIKMNLDSFQEDISQRRVLSHETTHVLQAVESNRALSKNFTAVKFFVEGMAQYTSFSVIPEEGRRQSNWDIASVAWKRQRIEFVDMINAQSFSERFDNELHYSLGDLWTQAMVDICGVDSLGDFLRAAGREGAPVKLSAREFWRDTMSEIDCDLDTVNAQWRELTQQRYDSLNPENYPEFYNMSVALNEQGNQVLLKASLRAYEQDRTTNEPTVKKITLWTRGYEHFVMPQQFSLRIGRDFSSLSSGVEPLFRGRVISEGAETYVLFRVPKFIFQGQTFRYQLGFASASEDRTYFEPWRRGSL